ncbi:RNA polymerase sigma-I factor [Paenalkalicoccus suaedae]|uniref:RNA polymerase sigma-I factor n=1 Tax=Paenalkalicoccus suaedae TaxID=2592382 RepID=UPI00158C905D|nr:RNA polymerase sigma-I factor [Paenalkalicoccus suaedae]
MLLNLTHQPTDDLYTKIKAIQAGQKTMEDEFIKQYIPYIRKVVASVCKKFIVPGVDDEFSVGLIAFNEAIHHYRVQKGSSFLTFANLVIKRRVIDYIRKEQRRSFSISLDYKGEEKENVENMAEAEASYDQFLLSLEERQRREEIEHLEETLKSYQISLSDVAKQRPKHRDARENMREIASLIANDESIVSYMKEKKRLPMKVIMEKINMSRKTMERNRKYIIAVVLVLKGDYDYLQDYFKAM